MHENRNQPVFQDEINLCVITGSRESENKILIDSGETYERYWYLQASTAQY